MSPQLLQRLVEEKNLLIPNKSEKKLNYQEDSNNFAIKKDFTSIGFAH